MYKIKTLCIGDEVYISENKWSYMYFADVLSIVTWKMIGNDESPYWCDVDWSSLEEVSESDGNPVVKYPVKGG